MTKIVATAMLAPATRSHESSRLTYNLLVQPIAIQPGNWLAVALAFGLLELLLQLGMMTLYPFMPVGDEVEYIARGRSTNPFRFRLFSRLPLLPAVAWFGARTGHPATFLRLVSAILSAVAMAATAGAATRVGGTVIASVLCIGLLMVPERVVLGSRIWPDVYLAAATSAIVLILTLTPSIGLDRSAALIGILVAIATLTRLDALVLILSAAFTWAMIVPTMSTTQIGWLTGLPLTAFAVWWAVSILVFNQRWPDTTWKFNLGIAAEEARVQQEDSPIVVDDLIQRHQAVSGDPGAERQQFGRPDRKTTPWTGFPLSVASRLRAMVGPDTFVQGKILADKNGGSGSVSRSVLSSLFRVSVPFLAALSIGVLIWQPSRAAWLAIPALSLMIPAVLFHARTRYRLPFLYGLVPVLAGTLRLAIESPKEGSSLSALVSAALIAALLAILVRQPVRLERP